jgi:methionyl-tRNA formyltransferase
MYTIWIAGSTHRTTQVAEAILADSRFSITHIITPQPRKVGRKQELVTNPLAEFAEKNKIDSTLVDKKIDQQVKTELTNLEKPDLLMVVDFGFWVPTWLLAWPKKAPLNIHPSLLPRWRGSSPGQNVLLNGETTSAVTLMEIIEQMDAGPIITQLPFKVEPAWNQADYYQFSFNLICEKLTDYLTKFMTGEIIAQPQPATSPTPLANKISKEQAFVDWSELALAMHTGQQATELERACRAYNPWPKLWTKVQTTKGEKRLIIHHCSLINHKLVLEQVQLEGKGTSSWSEIKSQLV